MLFVVCLSSMATTLFVSVESLRTKNTLLDGGDTLPKLTAKKTLTKLCDPPQCGLSALSPAATLQPRLKLPTMAGVVFHVGAPPAALQPDGGELTPDSKSCS